MEWVEVVQRCIDQGSIIILALLLVEVGIDGGLGLHGDRTFFDLFWRAHLVVDFAQDLNQVLMFLLSVVGVVVLLAHIRLGGSASTRSLYVDYGVCNGSAVHKF